MATFIPAEIWIYVAQFIPENDLRGMLDINRTFFQLAMDARYRNICFMKFHDAALRNMQRLRDPAIAHRVRTLDVIPWYGQILGDAHRGRPREDGSGFSASTEEVTRTMADTAICFSNLTEFSIQWTGMPSGEHLHPLLITVWRTFRFTMRKLVLEEPRRDFEALLPTAGSFTVLQELKVVFNAHARVGPGQRNPTVSGLATFINAVSPTLRRLSISSPYATDVDIAILFRSLGDIPNLEQLDIFANFDMCGLADPLGLTRILRTHATTLHRFVWDMAFEEKLSYSDPLTQLFVDWLERNRYDTSILSNLSTLQIVVPPSRLDLVMPYIRRSADTLTSLALEDEPLNEEEVDAVVSLFSHRTITGHLQKLRLCVKSISPELFLLLAQKLPRLHTLKLFPSNFRRGAHNDTGKAREFADIMRKKDISKWSLYDIEIFCDDLCISLKLMNVFGECVPSLQRLSGWDRQDLQRDIDEPL